MSAVGAAHDAPTINSRLHALSDDEIAGSGLPYTIVKPHFFAQNLLMGAQAAAQSGMLYLAFGEAKLGLIDARDISDFAVHVLANPKGHEKKTYTITGPASISMHEVAKAIGDAVGKPMQYVPVPVEAAQEAVTKMGADEWMVDMLGDYFTAYSRNWGDLVTEDFQKITGKAPRSIADFARDYAGAFGKA